MGTDGLRSRSTITSLVDAPMRGRDRASEAPCGVGTSRCAILCAVFSDPDEIMPRALAPTRTVGASKCRGNNTAQYAGRDGLFVRHCDVDTGRLLPEHVLVEADRRFAHGVRELGDMEPRLAIVLTEAPAQPSATQGYVYYEPCADLVVALSTVESQASMCATNTLWESWGPSFESLIASATELLKQGRVADALLHGIDGTCELFRRMRSGARRA
jgi:hypothetical protein